MIHQGFTLELNSLDTSVFIREGNILCKVTNELKEAVEKYKNRYNLHTDEEFIEHIDAKVVRGVY